MRPLDGITRLVFFLIAVGVLVLAGTVIYHQSTTPAIDAVIDWQTGVVLSVPQDSFANYAGLLPGDVILDLDSIRRHSTLDNRIVQIKRGNQTQNLELPFRSLAQLNLPDLASALIVMLACFGIGAYVLWRRFYQIEARLFFVLLLCVGAGWLLFSAYPQPTERPYWMAVLSSIGFHFAGALVVHYYLIFPVALGTPQRRRLILSVVYPGMLIALGLRLSETDLGIRLTHLYNALELCSALALLVYAYAYRATPDGRRRLRLVVIGTTIFGLPPILLYMVPIIVGATTRMPIWMVGLFLIASPISYMLAIIRDNLFNIDRILNRTLVYLILSLGILLLYLGPFLAIYNFAPNDWLAQAMIAASLTLLVGFAFDWSRALVQRWVDRVFYNGWYDYPGVIEKITAALARTLDRAQLVDVLTRQVSTLMQLHPGELRIDENPGFSENPGFLHQLQFPLSFQNQVRAVWTVGARRDDEDWSATDRRILQTLARQAEVALGNVLLVEMLRRQLDEIRAMQHELLRSREDERARLARDLHDGPIQDLVGLNMQLGLLLVQGTSIAESLPAVRGDVRALLSELRDVCAELRPPMLDTIGLGAALRVLADDWSNQSGIPITLDLSANAQLRTLPPEVAVNLYRLVQEALSNIARHAQAHQVALCLAWQDTRLTLTLQDDGSGFTVPTTFHDLVAQGHFGMAGMQERVTLIGGKWSVDSAPGKGTTIHVSWRLANS
ncbi:MAG: hypothetical protein HZB51_00545 [Chloroflexi bacterium]|nr:hypothetical protein [Chloroflexota bacterium]